MLLTLLFLVSVVVLVWTYFGYPALMALRARFQSIPIQKDEQYRPSVTLLIPAYNEADVIRRKLENSVKLVYPADKLEILVIDDGSSDGTAEIVREYVPRGVKLHQQPVRQGKMAGVNAGFERASGEIVILSDASPDYEPHAIEKLVRSFADPSVGVVVGKLAVWDAQNAVAKPAGFYWKYEAALRKWETQTGSTVAVHGNMFAIRRALHRPLRNATINDEFTLAIDVMRQGYRVVYEPEAISYDDASASMGDEFKRRARINAGRYQGVASASYLTVPNADVVFRFVSHKLMRSFAPIFMLLALITNVLQVLLDGGWSWWLLLAAQIVFYGLAAVGWKLEQAGKRSRIASIPYFFVSTNLAALVGLWRWITRTQKVTWQKRSAEKA
ncbi:MAG: glycosyltransferase family 2 protein [Anaerolineae bacterium]